MNFETRQHAVGSDYREFPVPAQLANHAKHVSSAEQP